jgi:CMP-N,N'-diacetyllegionaminic acid synthase
MSLLITLCARGGSKGIPGKNIKLINGKPLLAYSIETARKFSSLCSAVIALSTDDDRIKEVAAQYGITTTYERPSQFATDNAGKADAIDDLLRFEEKKAATRFDYILDLDVTSPLRTVEDLSNAFEIIQNDSGALNLFSVNHAARNPYFNMVEVQENGYYGLVKKGQFLTRQSAPKVYELNASFYFYRRQYFDLAQRSTINNRSLMYVMPHICFDLDEPIDFEFMAYLLENNKLGFEI